MRTIQATAELPKLPEPKQHAPIYPDESREDQYAIAKYVTGWNDCHAAFTRYLAGVEARRASRAQSELVIALGMLEYLSEYPDFTAPEGELIGTAIADALAGKMPKLLIDIGYLSQGLKPPASALPGVPATSAFNIPAGWTAKLTHDGRVAIYSDDFAHDVKLIVFGDFRNEAERLTYATNLAARMSAPPVDAVPGEPVAQDVALWQLVYGAMLGTDKTPKSVDDFEAAAKRVAEMIECRQLAASVASPAGTEPVTADQAVAAPEASRQGEAVDVVEKVIAAALRQHGLTLLKNASGYEIDIWAPIVAQLQAGTPTQAEIDSGPHGVLGNVPADYAASPNPQDSATPAPAAATEPSQPLGNAEELPAKLNTSLEALFQEAIWNGMMEPKEGATWLERMARQFADRAGVAAAAEPSDDELVALWGESSNSTKNVIKFGRALLSGRERAASLDTKRLDWIESKVCDVSRLGDATRTLRISWNNGADSVFVGPGYSATWREAIDRASAGEAQS